MAGRRAGEGGTSRWMLVIEANKESRVLHEQLEELGASHRGRRFGLLGCGRLYSLGRGLLGFSLLRPIGLLLDRADLHAASQKRSLLYADPMGYHISRQRAVAAEVQAVGALDVALYVANDHNFAGTDVGGDATATPNGDTLTGKINSALDSAIDEQRLGPGDFTFDDQ